MAVIASAPDFCTACAMCGRSATKGVTLIDTGTREAASFTHLAVRSVSSASCPIVEPIPRSGMPCGHEKLHSMKSTPAASSLLTSLCQCSFFWPMMLAPTTLWGYAFFSSRTSFSTWSMWRSEIRSMFSRPITFLSSKSSPAIMG